MIKAIPSQSSSTSLLGISIAPGFIRLSRSLQSSSELYPSLSSSMIKAIPSQSSSTSLFGISIAPGFIRLSWSLQSSSELYPSLSSSMIKAIPSQSSSTSLLGISSSSRVNQTILVIAILIRIISIIIFIDNKSNTVTILINIIVRYFSSSRVNQTILVIAILIRVITIIIFIDVLKQYRRNPHQHHC